MLLALALLAAVVGTLAISALSFRVGEMIAASRGTFDKLQMKAEPPNNLLPSTYSPSDNLNFTPRRAPVARNHYLYLIRTEAKKSALPAEIADAVAYVESAYDPVRIGDAGEIGLMQVRPSTARVLGFRGSAVELFNPAKNVHYGVLYLAQAWRLAKGDFCRTLMRYRAGHGARNMTPKSTEYCLRAKAYLQSQRATAVSARKAPPVPTAPPSTPDAPKPHRNVGLFPPGRTSTTAMCTAPQTVTLVS